VVVDHKVDTCQHCGNNLAGETATISQSRQVWDVKIVPLVTQHQVQSKTCSLCGKTTTADFPQGVDHYIQYGDHYKSLMIYLSKGNFIPYDRLAAFSQDILDIPVSQGTLVNMVYELGQSLKESMDYIKGQIKQSPVAHFDETGIHNQKKNYWLHSAGTDRVHLPANSS
jgi:transposase